MLEDTLHTFLQNLINTTQIYQTRPYITTIMGCISLGIMHYQGFNAIRWNNTGVFMGRPIVKTQEYMGDKREDGQVYLEDGRCYYDVAGADICMFTCVGDRRAVTYWVFC